MIEVLSVWSCLFFCLQHRFYLFRKPSLPVATGKRSWVARYKILKLISEVLRKTGDNFQWSQMAHLPPLEFKKACFRSLGNVLGNVIPICLLN